jgi:hypothetical protein
MKLIGHELVIEREATSLGVAIHPVLTAGYALGVIAVIGLLAGSLFAITVMSSWVPGTLALMCVLWLGFDDLIWQHFTSQTLRIDEETIFGSPQRPLQQPKEYEVSRTKVKQVRFSKGLAPFPKVELECEGAEFNTFVVAGVRLSYEDRRRLADQLGDFLSVSVQEI